MIDDTCHFRLRHKEITVVDLLIPPEEMMAVNIVGHHMIHMIALSRLTTFPGEKQIPMRCDSTDTVAQTYVHEGCQTPWDALGENAQVESACSPNH